MNRSPIPTLLIAHIFFYFLMLEAGAFQTIYLLSLVAWALLVCVVSVSRHGIAFENGERIETKL